MRLALRIGLGLLAAWLVYAASPYVALYRLARAVEARDLQGIRERVNLRAVGVSFARQIVPEYLKAIERERELRPADRDLAVSVGATVADPLIAGLLSPEALVDLLEDGWPESVVPGRPENFSGLDADVLRQAGRLFLASRSRGFRVVTVSLPEDRPPDEQFHLHLRFGNLSWRVIRIDLPASLRRSLVARLPQGR